MDDCLINPTRLDGDPLLTGPCLFWPNPGDSNLVLQERKKIHAPQLKLFHSNLIEVPDPSPIYWAGPAMGAPMAVFCLEKLIACGIKDIIVFGSCGSLTNTLGLGDILSPTWFLSEEGTSHHYPHSCKNIETNSDLREQLCHYIDQYTSLQITQGPLWTTDAPYRETKSKVSLYGQKGLLAVDMELSALAAVASFRNVRLAACLVVSDVLNNNCWRHGFKNKLYRQSRKTLFHATNSFLHHYRQKIL